MMFHPTWWWMIFLLPLAAVALLRPLRSSMRGVISFRSLDAVDHAPRGRLVRFNSVLWILRATTIALLVLALARPVIPNESSKSMVEGVAIELVIDRSDSMRALDFTLNDQRANRLDALKDVVRTFVVGGNGFRGRPNDLIGIIAFARNADSVVPLTLDHEVALDALAQIRFPDDGSEMGTAIGDAIALGVDKLKDAADRANKDGKTRVKSRVLLLLTDGESNAGELAPAEAAALAKSTDVKIYAIGLGTKGFAEVPVRTPFGEVLQRVPVSIDEKTLTEISTATGGRYFRATDSDSLTAIYATIDALEKSSIEETKLVRYRDLALESFPLDLLVVAPFTMPAILILAGITLMIEVLLATTRLRTLA